MLPVCLAASRQQPAGSTPVQRLVSHVQSFSSVLTKSTLDDGLRVKVCGVFDGEQA